jgi:hypothetical protein
MIALPQKAALRTARPDPSLRKRGLLRMTISNGPITGEEEEEVQLGIAEELAWRIEGSEEIRDKERIGLRGIVFHFLISPLPVAEGQPDTYCHRSQWRRQ